ncbi:MAG: hypothetical protein ACK2T3_14700, partial [Candidatus Promineifilaceae bacterium]
MNLSGILEAIGQLPAAEKLPEKVESSVIREPLGLQPSARPPVLAHLFSKTGRTMLLICGRVESVPTWMQELESWLPPGSGLVRFPEPTPLPYERGPWSSLSRNKRLSVLSHLAQILDHELSTSETPTLVVTSARALLHYTLPLSKFLTAAANLQLGQRVDLEKLEHSWIDIGYEPSSVVEAVGQFSRRGGIIDIFPIAANKPYRIERSKPRILQIN